MKYKNKHHRVITIKITDRCCRYLFGREHNMVNKKEAKLKMTLPFWIAEKIGGKEKVLGTTIISVIML